VFCFARHFGEDLVDPQKNRKKGDVGEEKAEGGGYLGSGGVRIVMEDFRTASSRI